MELKNYDENTKAAIIAQQMQQSAAASGGKFSAEKPFPPGGEYDQQSMGVIPVSHTVMQKIYHHWRLLTVASVELLWLL
jgi:hypothetical protein